MAEWRIKEISDVTQTSVRMLRHYDKIGILKPSYRSSNGYRCYTAQDLAKLQQIIALRYFGFSLGTIGKMLQKHQNVYAHLQAQQQVLKNQSDHLQKVNDALGDILKRLSPSEIPNWNDLITLIERYRMTENLREKLRKTRGISELSESQFEDYLAIYEQFPKEFAMRDKMIEQINNNEFGDPAGPDGERVVTFMNDLAKQLKDLFAQSMKLGTSVMESVRSGKVTQLQVTPEGALWMGKATVSYWLRRWDALYDRIVENLKADPDGKIGKKVAGEWTKLIDETFSMGGSRSFLMGTILWQELARQDHELKKLKEAPSPQDAVKQFHAKLFFNPEATTWISRALELHSK